MVTHRIHTVDNPLNSTVCFIVIIIGINIDLVPQLFGKVQFSTRTLGRFNLVSKVFKRVYFGTFR